MSGKRFRLREATVALRQGDGKPELTELPQGAVVLVTETAPMSAKDEPNRQINVECEGGRYTMFLVDVQERGEPLAPK